MIFRKGLYLLVASTTTSIALLDNVTQPAFADPILFETCALDTCSQTLFLGKTLLEQTSDGTLYSVELSSKYADINTGSYGDFEEPRAEYIYCSTIKPAHIFEIPASIRFSDPTPYRASLLNPGRSRTFDTSYPIYWVTCHNFVGPDFQIDESHARSLGYTLNLQETQISINDPRDILN